MEKGIGWSWKNEILLAWDLGKSRVYSLCLIGSANHFVGRSENDKEKSWIKRWNGWSLLFKNWDQRMRITHALDNKVGGPGPLIGFHVVKVLDLGICCKLSFFYRGIDFKSKESFYFNQLKRFLNSLSKGVFPLLY